MQEIYIGTESLTRLLKRNTPKSDQSEFGNKVTQLTVLKAGSIHFWGGSGVKMIIRVTNNDYND